MWHVAEYMLAPSIDWYKQVLPVAGVLLNIKLAIACYSPLLGRRGLAVSVLETAAGILV